MSKFITDAQITAELQRITALEKLLLKKMTTREAAAHAGVCLATFRNWEARGITPARTEGYRRLYIKAEVLAFVQRLREDFVFRYHCGIYLPKRYAKMEKMLFSAWKKTAGTSATLTTSDQD